MCIYQARVRFVLVLIGNSRSRMAVPDCTVLWRIQFLSCCYSQSEHIRDGLLGERDNEGDLLRLEQLWIVTNQLLGFVVKVYLNKLQLDALNLISQF